MKFNIRSMIDAFGLGSSVMGIISGYNRSTCYFTLIMFIIALIIENISKK